MDTDRKYKYSNPKASTDTAITSEASKKVTIQYILRKTNKYWCPEVSMRPYFLNCFKGEKRHYRGMVLKYGSQGDKWAAK